MKELMSPEAAKEIIESNQVDFDDAWKALGFSTKQKAEQLLKNNFDEGVDFTSLNQTVKREIGATRKNQITLTYDCFKMLGMMAGTAKGKEVRRYFIQIEKAFYVAKEEWSQVHNRLKEEIKATAEQIKQYDKVVDPFEHIASLERNVKLLEEKAARLEALEEKVTKSKKHITTNQINKIKKLNEQGLSTRQIAKTVGASASSVQVLLRKLKSESK